LKGKDEAKPKKKKKIFKNKEKGRPGSKQRIMSSGETVRPEKAKDKNPRKNHIKEKGPSTRAEKG